MFQRCLDVTKRAWQIGQLAFAPPEPSLDASRTSRALAVRVVPGSRWIATVILLVALLWFGALEYRGLFAPDEGRYADIAREMARTGDWVTPRLNGLKYFEKPPLQYWATAGSYALFGIDEWTTRLWPAAAGFLGLALVAFAWVRLSPARPWLLPALMLAGTWGYFIGAQFVTLDMSVTFFLTATLAGFVLAQQPSLPSGAQRAWMLVAWAAMALAVLSKGLIGIVLPALALTLYAAIERDGSILRRLHALPGLCVFLLIVLPWFILVQEKNPEFLRFFFVQEHFERYALPIHHRTGPWWYFIPVLGIGLFPWTPSVPSVIARAWQARPAGGFNVDRFLLVWSGGILAFFSLSSSKLPLYVLPAVPALVLLVARHLPSLSVRARAGPAMAAALGGTALMLVAPFMERIERLAPLKDFVLGYAGWVFAAGLIMCVTGIGALFLLRRPRADASIVTLGLGSLLGAQLLLSGTHAVDEYYSAERVIEKVTGESLQFRSDPPFYSVGTFDDTVPFYLGRPVTLVGYRGELAPGIAAEPQKYIASIAEFRERWQAETEAFAVMTPLLYDQLREEGLPMRVLARDVRRIIVAR